MPRRRAPLLALTLTLGLATPAAADVIDSTWTPPRCPSVECPRGAAPLPSGNHSSCSPGCGVSTECASDEECSHWPGARCEDTALCLEEGMVPMRGPGMIVRGACGEGDACAAGACSRARRCVRPPAPPPAPPPEPTEIPDEVVVEGPESDEPEQTDSEEREASGGGGGCNIASSASPTPLGLVAIALLGLALRRRSRPSPEDSEDAT